jgi:PAS domain S-box-containing protein
VPYAARCGYRPGVSDEELDAPFRGLFELSPDAILVFTAGVVTQANPAAVALLRASSADALVGLPSRDLLHPDYHPLVERNVKALLSGTVQKTCAEEKYIRLDATLVDVEATAALAPFLGEKSFIVILRDISDRKEAELQEQREREAVLTSEAAVARERWLREIVELLPSGIMVRDEDRRVVLVNKLGAELLARSVDELMGRTLDEVGLEMAARLVADEDRKIFTTGEPVAFADRKFTDATGRRRVLQGVKARIRYRDRAAVLAVYTDVTERRELEAQLLHSQKMEGLGRLAGGVAHDFNNLLTVIIECTDHLSGTLGAGAADLDSIREAATRAASLTRQLLTFARQVQAMPRIVFIDEVVGQVARLLVRMVGEDIAVVTELDAATERVNLDPGQLELVIMNLAVNARDAMPDGGKLVIATRSREGLLSPTSAAERWIELSVRDTGTGMDEATRARAVEPFFTTKAAGRGTGLGLSTCYGVVEQLGGRLTIESALGSGTQIQILLPSVSAEAVAADDEKKKRSVPRADGHTVLLLEDDAAVRRATQRMLVSLGYSVLTAALPSEALAIARDHAGPIDLLVTDVVMPQMNGVVAAASFAELRPKASVLFVSGYSRDAFPNESAIDNYLSKPFTRDELARKLRETIERARGSSAAPTSA